MFCVVHIVDSILVVRTIVKQLYACCCSQKLCQSLSYILHHV